MYALFAVCALPIRARCDPKWFLKVEVQLCSGWYLSALSILHWHNNRHLFQAWLPMDYTNYSLTPCGDWFLYWIKHTIPHHERLNSYALHSSEPSSVASISVRSQESGWELHDQSDRFHLNLVRVTVKLHSKQVERRFNWTELHQCSRTIPRWTGPCIGVMYWLMDGSEFWTRTYCIESWWVILIPTSLVDIWIKTAPDVLHNIWTPLCSIPAVLCCTVLYFTVLYCTVL
jgi:hypothetical protein